MVLFPVFSFANTEEKTDEEFIYEEVAADEPEESSIHYNGSSYDFIFSWKKKATEAHWTGLGFAFTDLSGLKEVDLKRGKSYSLIMNMGDFVVPLSSNWLIFTGLGLDFSRYHFKGNVGLQEIPVTDQEGQLVPGRTYTGFLDAQENENYEFSKLITYYVTIPLMFEYQTKLHHNNTFFINGGVEGMIKYYSRSQIGIYNLKGGVNKKVLGKGLNILPINYRMVLRAGFDDFSVFGYYQPVSLFEKDKGPDIKPWGVGLMLNF